MYPTSLRQISSHPKLRDLDSNQDKRIRVRCPTVRPASTRRLIEGEAGDPLILVQCCGTWIRTKILASKGRCPTVRRSRSTAQECIKILLLIYLRPAADLKYFSRHLASTRVGKCSVCLTAQGAYCLVLCKCEVLRYARVAVVQCCPSIQYMSCGQ